ncbi:MAG: tetratricopeptide repeat protein [Fimbriimonadaceae bacterium]|nr:tetratricopeptide repeat protein [Fimbriimonadaceae bacterium]
MATKVLVLGTVGVQTDSGLVTTFRTASARRVLLHLALRGNLPIDRAELAQLVWPDTEETNSRTSLRTALASLRKLSVELGGDKERVSLLTETDLDQFRRLVRKGDRAGACLAYGGLFASGESDLILIHAAEAFEAQFVEAYRATAGSTILRRLDLDRMVFSDSDLAGRLRAEAQTPLRVGRYGMPDQAHPHPLLERDALLGQILARIGTERWLTLVAPGGSGKSRLALEVARRMADGGVSVLWISLEGRSDSTDWVQIMREALGLESVAGLDPARQLEHFLSTGKWLVVVDGAEDNGSVAAEITRLSLRLASLSVITTSRFALDGVPGAIIPVPALETAPCPHRGVSPASVLMRYFARAAGSRHADALSDPSNSAERAESVGDRQLDDLATRLGGHPLAMQLAAAQLGTDWSPARLAQLRTRMDRLVNPTHAEHDRHADLAKVLGWSLQECSPALRERLGLLALFGSGFRSSALPATEFAELRRLEVISPRGPGLWRFIEPFRNLVLQRGSAESMAEARREYCDYWYRQACQAGEVSFTRDEQPFFALLDEEHESITAALELLNATDPARFVEAVTHLSWFWVMRGRFSQGIRWGQAALQAEPALVFDTRLRHVVGLNLYCIARFAEAEEMLHQAYELAKASQDTARASLAGLNLASLCCESKRPERAVTLLDESLRTLGAEPRPGRRAAGRVLAALIYNRLRRPHEAIEHAQIAHETCCEIEYLWGIGSSLNELGNALASLGRHEAAESIQHESAEARRKTGFQRGVAVALVDRSRSLIALRRPDEARACLAEALNLYEKIGDRWGQARALRAAAELAHSEERAWDRLILWAAADRADQAFGGTSTDNASGPAWLSEVSPADWAAARALARQTPEAEIGRARL